MARSTTVVFAKIEVQGGLRGCCVTFWTVCWQGQTDANGRERNITYNHIAIANKYCSRNSNSISNPLISFFCSIISKQKTMRFCRESLFVAFTIHIVAIIESIEAFSSSGSALQERKTPLTQQRAIRDHSSNFPNSRHSTFQRHPAICSTIASTSRSVSKSSSALHVANTPTKLSESTSADDENLSAMANATITLRPDSSSAESKSISSAFATVAQMVL